MLQQDKNIDISFLPPQARSRLLDYYGFLKQKYVPEKLAETDSRFREFLDQPVHVERFKILSREDIHER